MKIDRVLRSLAMIGNGEGEMKRILTLWIVLAMLLASIAGCWPWWWGPPGGGGPGPGPRPGPAGPGPGGPGPGPHPGPVDPPR